MRSAVVTMAVLLGSSPAGADNETVEAWRNLAIHGFVSQGAFISTANDYIGKSSRGSFELFEAGLNVSTEVSDRLRVGMQLFTRDAGVLGNYRVNMDWAYIDYRWRPWLGIRAGHIKLPFGLYNEYTDIDTARPSILLPQAVYPIDSRDVLLAHTGFAGYGTYDLEDAGSLEYQLYTGTFFIAPASSTTVDATEVDPKYVVGGQLFWRSEAEDLRFGASGLRTSVDYKFKLSQELIDFYISQGSVPEDFDGNVELYLRPAHLLIGSAEYTHDEWTFSAEYSRWFIKYSSKPGIVPVTKSDSERFYAMASYRASDEIELSTYYSVLHVDANDRAGRDSTAFPIRWRAWQRDATATLRYDVSDHWLWKLEGHFIDGAADVKADLTPMPKRYWGLFMVRTTLAF